jgi:hypothetical protein
MDSDLDEAAELFVAVDAGHGDEPFWSEVRASGG